MDNKPIYVITTVRHTIEAGMRSVGFYYEFNFAEVEVEHNAFDINEAGYYPYAVIEEITQGLYSYPIIEHWYKFNREKDRYEACEKPDKFKKICGWSLG